MIQKRMFKVISPIERKDGTTFWMRVGSAFPNKDGSINVYVDAMPKDLKFQLREYDEADLREREARRNAHSKPPDNPTLPLAEGLNGVPF